MNKLIVAAVAAVVMASLNAPVASAQTRSYPDHDGGPGVAMTSITVKNTAHYLRVDMRHKSVVVANTVWINSRAGEQTRSGNGSYVDWAPNRGTYGPRVSSRPGCIAPDVSTSRVAEV